MLVLFDSKGEKKAEISCALEKTVSAAVWLSGRVKPLSLCNGLGLCGRCRGRYLNKPPQPTPAELSFFTDEQLRQGWRLLCRHGVPDYEAHLELPDYAWQGSKTALRQAEGGKQVNLGIDLGTTSLQWQATDAKDVNEIVAAGQQPNPQAGAGSDIISRIAYAKESWGLQKLSNLAWQAMGEILLVLQTGNYTVKRICVAANSALTTILLTRKMDGFVKAPWRLDYGGGEIIRYDFAQTGQKEIIIPPLIAPFIGGDISAGILAMIRSRVSKPFLLVDMGTNCEFALMTETGKLFFASTPLGPALEGIGPVKGMAAEPGAITGFYLSPQGLGRALFPGTETVRGISGSGYMALLAILRKLEIMTESGQFRPSAKHPLAAKISAHLTSRDNMPVLDLGENLYLTGGDVEQLLKIKAAFTVALQNIMAEAGVGADKLKHLCLAGALGKHIKIADLAALGFLPAALVAKTVACGNTALAGACLLAANPSELQYLQNLCNGAQLIDLVNDAHFEKDYIDAMHWA